MKLPNIFLYLINEYSCPCKIISLICTYGLGDFKNFLVLHAVPQSLKHI